MQHFAFESLGVLAYWSFRDYEAPCIWFTLVVYPEYKSLFPSSVTIAEPSTPLLHSMCFKFKSACLLAAAGDTPAKIQSQPAMTDGRRKKIINI